IDVRSWHQGLARYDLVVQPAVEEPLAVVPLVREVAVRRQQKRRQDVREERRPICRVWSPVAKKKVLSLTSGAPNVAENWFSSSGTSAGLTAVSVVGVMQQLATDGAQKPSVPNVFACQPPGRVMNSPSPRTSFVPDLVTMFSAGPAVQPNSAEN